LSGTPIPWKELPEAVRSTILSNGGKEGQPADLENKKRNNLSLYKAPTTSHFYLSIRYSGSICIQRRVGFISPKADPSET
jgi:hypothetical protein